MKKFSTLIIYILALIFLNSPNAHSQNSEWLYEGSSDGTTPSARSECAFVKAGNKFYFIGSRGKKALDIYDPAAKIWTIGAVVPLEIHHFQAVEYNGLIYVVGGFTGGYPTETPLSTIYIYDPGSDSWNTGPEIPADRRRGSAGAIVYNQKIYIVAGAANGHTSGQVLWFDEYDPLTETWNALPDAPRLRDHFHAAVVGNKLVLAGGRVSSYPNTFGITVPEVDIYDFSFGLWTTASDNIPTPRAGAAVAVLGDEVLVIGGESMSQMNAHNETEAFNVSTGKWRTLDTLNQGRHGSQALVYNNTIYIAGGSKSRGGSASTELNSMEKYLGNAVISGLDPGALIGLAITSFPNPFYDNVVLSYDSDIKIDQVFIYNATGENMKGIEVVNGRSEISIDKLSDFPSGIYYIVITAEGLSGYGSIKVVKR